MVTVMRECLSLGRKKRVVPFLAEGEAKATVLGASLPAMVLMNRQWGPLQILHSRSSGVFRLGGGGEGGGCSFRAL